MKNNNITSNIVQDSKQTKTCFPIKHRLLNTTPQIVKAERREGETAQINKRSNT